MAKHNPFSIFRRNQRAWMAGLTLFTMFSFIALGSMLQCVGSRNQGGGVRYIGDVANTKKFGKLDYNSYLAYRNDAVRLESFLTYLASTALYSLNAAPSYDLSSLRLQLTSGLASPELLVDRWLVTQYGKSAKLQGSDADSLEYLRRLAKISKFNFGNNEAGAADPNNYTVVEDAYPADVLKDALRRSGLTETSLREILRDVVAYERFLRKFDSGSRMTPNASPENSVAVGAFGHAGFDVSPEDQVDAYNALNSPVRAKVAVFNAEAFVDKVAEPSDAELRKLYEQYKNVVFNPDAKVRGFTQPNKLALEVARVEITDEMLDAISAEDVAKYYEEHKESFRRPSAQPAPTADLPGAENISLPDAGSLDVLPEDALNAVPDAAEEAAPAEAPAEAPAAEETAPAEAPAEAPAIEEAAPAENAEAPVEGAAVLRQSQLFASYQQEAEAPAAEEAAPAENAEAPAEAPAAEEAAPAENAEAPAAEEAAPAENTEAPAAEEAAPAENAEAPAAEEAAPAAEEAAPAENAEETAAEETPSEYFELSEVEGQIRRMIAAQRIEEKMAAVEAALREDYNNSVNSGDETKYRPTVVFKALAEENGFQYQFTKRAADKDASIPEAVSANDARVMDILPAEALNTLYGDSLPYVWSADRVGRYDAEKAPYSIPNVFYVWRVVKVVPQNTPDFDDSVDSEGVEKKGAREDVLREWKTIAAAKVADTAALNFVEKINAGADFDATAAELGGVVKETEKFTWFAMTGFNLRIGEVRESGVEVGQAERDNTEIVAPGWDFYETAYSLPVDGVGTCKNQPEDRTFVIKVVEKETLGADQIEKISEDFFARQIAPSLASARLEKYHQDIVEKLRKEAGFEWISIPRPER